MELLAQQIAALARRIDQIALFFNKLGNKSEIPQEVEAAFRERLKIGDLAKLTSSTHSVGDESQSVNEAGSATYSVAKPMDGFVAYKLPDGSIVNIPYYT